MNGARSLQLRAVLARYSTVPDESTMPTLMIVSDPNVMMGKPVVAGTRITVELILEKVAAGETIEDIVQAHPRLTPDAVRAALRFAL